MKSAVLFIAICLVAAAQAGLTKEEFATLKGFYEKCLASSGVDPEIVAKTRKGEFTDDDKLKNYMLCMFEKLQFVNKDGELRLDVIRSKMPKDIDKDEAEKVFSACKDKKGTDAADTVFLVYKCYWENSPNHVTLA